MKRYVKAIFVGFVGLALLLANLIYRVFFVPEVISNVAQQGMSREAGDSPAIAMRVFTEATGLGAFLSVVVFVGLILVMYSRDLIGAAKKALKQGESECVESGTESQS